MSIIQWDPWQALQRLRAETDRLWEEYLSKLQAHSSDTEAIAFLPDVDFVETSHEYRLYLAMPGLIEEDFDLWIEPNELIIRGDRQCPYDTSYVRSRVHEWRYGFFERRFQFPQTILTSEVRAHYDAGVLTVILPKATDQ